MSIASAETIAMVYDDAVAVSTSETREDNLSRSRGIDLASIRACKVYALMETIVSFDGVSPMPEHRAYVVGLIPQWM